jgi:hypothetical protein
MENDRDLSWYHGLMAESSGTSRTSARREGGLCSCGFARSWLARRERLWQETRVRALDSVDTPMGRVVGATGVIWVRGDVAYRPDDVLGSCGWSL